ncbi:MAG: hypothetical protein HY822_05425 [Acidobacteria bacterium]|nr:hypothetical protein [Acidobacteriota bacterium]
MRTAAACVCLATLAFGQQIADNTEFRVKLLAPLSTETNRKGDKIAAQVVSPPQFAGAMMEGEVKESKSGGKVTGKSVLNFTFQTLAPKEGQPIPVSSEVKGFVNSQGKANVDEEGRVIEKKSNVGKVAAVTGAGALIGAIAGGAKGAAIGAGAGAAASLILIQVAAKGANVTFAPGSEVTLSVRERRQ